MGGCMDTIREKDVDDVSYLHSGPNRVSIS